VRSWTAIRATASSRHSFRRTGADDCVLDPRARDAVSTPTSSSVRVGRRSQAPKLVSNELVARMRPGRCCRHLGRPGWCFEATHPTSTRTRSSRSTARFSTASRHAGRVSYTSTYRSPTPRCLRDGTRASRLARRGGDDALRRRQRGRSGHLRTVANPSAWPSVHYLAGCNRDGPTGVVVVSGLLLLSSRD